MDLLTPLLLAGSLGGTFQDALPPAPPADPSLYSFADVYRLTVAGEAAASSPLAGATLLVASDPPRAGAEPRFSVSPARAPAGWTLVVSGLALAGWVAHRRLVHPL